MSAAAPGRPQNYAELARSHRLGVDYRIVLRRRANSPVAVIAPHGGAIERGTSRIADAIAGEDFNLYLFEGLPPRGSFDALHLTSHRFDEPECLALIAGCDLVLAVHGCEAEPDPGVLLGGLDVDLKRRCTEALQLAGIATLSEGHRYPAQRPDNICNRGRRGRGVQVECSGLLREGPLEAAAVTALRRALVAAGGALEGVR